MLLFTNMLSQYLTLFVCLLHFRSFSLFCVRVFLFSHLFSLSLPFSVFLFNLFCLSVLFLSFSHTFSVCVFLFSVFLFHFFSLSVPFSVFLSHLFCLSFCFSLCCLVQSAHTPTRTRSITSTISMLGVNLRVRSRLQPFRKIDYFSEQQTSANNSTGYRYSKITRYSAFIWGRKLG